jgi:asparagine synthase (glutamine-hydrolysing)
MNPSNESERYYSEKFYELFKESIQIRLISEVPLGAYLSGGIDSSSVVAMMSELMEEPVKTFSVGFGEKRVDELNYSRFVADYLETDHHEFIVEPKSVDLLPKIVWYFDEPVADPAAIPVYLLSELAKKYVTVVLLGEGGDELFAGYEQYKIICNSRKYIKYIPNFLKSNLISRVPLLTPKKFLNYFFRYSSSLGNEGIKRASQCLENIDKNVLKSYLKIVSIFDEDELEKLYSKENTKTLNNFSINEISIINLIQISFNL